MKAAEKAARDTRMDVEKNGCGKKRGRRNPRRWHCRKGGERALARAPPREKCASSVSWGPDCEPWVLHRCLGRDALAGVRMEQRLEQLEGRPR